ncbi:MAG: ATP-binding protein [Gemmatimonadaceae bacterium]
MSAANEYPRSLEQTLFRDLTVYPVVAVMGARQVGKSTLCRKLADKLGFVQRTLDDRDVREQAVSDPEGLLAELGDQGAFLDEVQRAPDLMLAIKAVVDRDQRPGRFLVSGSNQPTVSQAVSDSLLGRATYRTLRPLTLSELRFDERHAGWSFLFAPDEGSVVAELERRSASNGALDWHETVRTGGFPRALAAPGDHRLRLLDDYVKVFSSRDIRDLIAIESTPRFESFLRLTAALTGQQLNASGMSADLGIPVTTVKRWIDALQRSYLVELVPAYSRNASQRVIKSPKLFMVDAALALAAASETNPTGFHLETLVATDLQVWKDGEPGRGLHHWRLNSGQEVDFILEEHSTVIPVEVKASVGVSNREARHLRTFRERHANSLRGLLLSCDPEIRVLDAGVIASPWWAVL